MPEHDEHVAPECTHPVAESRTGWLCPHCGKQVPPPRLSKAERWGVEDKVVEAETK